MEERTINDSEAAILKLLSDWFTTKDGKRLMDKLRRLWAKTEALPWAVFPAIMAVGWCTSSKPLFSPMFFITFSVITFITNVRHENGWCNKWMWWLAFIIMCSLAFLLVAVVIGQYDPMDKGIVGPVILVMISMGMTLAG
jgi:hypothetical protein